MMLIFDIFTFIGLTILHLFGTLWTGHMATVGFVVSCGVILSIPKELNDFLFFLSNSPKYTLKKFISFFFSLIKYLLYFLGGILLFCFALLVGFSFSAAAIGMILNYYQYILSIL